MLPSTYHAAKLLSERSSDLPGALEVAQRRLRVGLEGQRVRPLQRRQVRARVRRLELRRRPIEVDGARDVQHLDEHEVVAARLCGAKRPLAQGCRGVVLGAREQDRDADAQCECEVAPCLVSLELGNESIEEIVGVR